MKAWYKSKTFWLGALQLLAAVSLFVHQFITDHQTITDPEKIALFTNGLIMVVLRWVTDKPITSPVKVMDKLRNVKTD